MDLPTKVWWATEIRVWTLALAAILAAVSFASTWAQTRWQAELAEQKEWAASERERASNERIASAQKEAALANERTAAVALQTETLRQENAKLTERLAWRTLPTQQQTAQRTMPANSMLVITLGEMEAANFGEQIIAALTSAGVNVLRFSIGSMSPSIYGVVYFDSNWNPAGAEMLERAHIQATKSSLPLPIPVSAQSQYQGIPAILVGLRRPP